VTVTVTVTVTVCVRCVMYTWWCHQPVEYSACVDLCNTLYAVCEQLITSN